MFVMVLIWGTGDGIAWNGGGELADSGLALALAGY